MAKSDFNVEETNDFDNQANTKKNSFFGNNSMNNIGSPEIVYDDNSDTDFLGRIKYSFSKINRSVIIFFGAILLAVIIGIIVVFAIISGYNNSFKTEFKIPDVVYIGETAAISAISSGSGDVSKTTVTFENKILKDEEANEDDPTPELALELASTKMTGSEIYNTLIPIEEGAVTISAKASSGTHNMGNIKKNVYVCPRFNSDLVPNGIISIRAGDELKNTIDFGPGACSKKIKYKSSNTDIFTVDKEGKICLYHLLK